MQANRRVSVGIMLCRTGTKGTPEMLLVKNRITHSYNEFVYGKYKSWNIDVLQNMFNRMSVHEKLFLLTMDFSKIWHYIWLKVHTPGDPDSNMYEFYIHCRNRFEKFTKDGGRRLRQLINNSTSGEPGWEIPKGRREQRELDIDCATREFREETNIPPQCYNILWNVEPITVTYQTDNNSIYHNRYYIGVLNKEYEHVPLLLDFNNNNQIYEITALKWFPLYNIQYIQLQTPKIYGLIKRGIVLYKKYRATVRSA